MTEVLKPELYTKLDVCAKCSIFQFSKYQFKFLWFQHGYFDAIMSHEWFIYYYLAFCRRTHDVIILHFCEALEAVESSMNLYIAFDLLNERRFRVVNLRY